MLSLYIKDVTNKEKIRKLVVLLYAKNNINPQELIILSGEELLNYEQHSPF